MARNKQPKGLKRGAPKKAQVMGLYARSMDCMRVNIRKRPRLGDDEGREDSPGASPRAPTARSGRRATNRDPPRSQSPLHDFSYSEEEEEEEQHCQHGEESEEEGSEEEGAESQEEGSEEELEDLFAHPLPAVGIVLPT